MNKVPLIITLFLTAIITIHSQDSTKNNQHNTTLAIFPFQSIGIDELTIKTSELILIQEIIKIGGVDIIGQEKIRITLGSGFCKNKECAVLLGRNLAADQVLLTTLSKLGKKIILQFMLFDVKNNQTLIIDNITSECIENLDSALKRIAYSIVNLETINESARVGTIMINESIATERRNARKYIGFSFGYLYPSKGYGDTDRSFTIDYHVGYELTDLAIGVKFALRQGFAANIFTSYLTTKKDFCPYVGGAFGFHWVSHPDNYNYFNEKKKSDGFELIVHTGFKAFRTYNFQLNVNLDYAFTFNDYGDQALIFTLGFLH